MRAADAVLALGLSLSVAACADEPGKREASHCENRGETLTRGMTKQSESGLFSTSLVDADPLPPLQGPNLWTIEVLTSSGDPVMDVLDPQDPTEEGDSEVVARIYMVEHMHRLDKFAVMTEPGIFEVPFPVTMNGYWELTFSVRDDQAPDDDPGDPTVFDFCVE